MLVRCVDAMKWSESLRARYPEIADELDVQANGFTAEDIRADSKLSVHWCCKKGHKYTDTPYRRTEFNYRCGECIAQLPK